MKLGLVADIHEHSENLRAALDQLRRLGVDQIVILGDVCEMGRRLEETCSLLADAGVVGVWGNHDFGLCYEPTAEVRACYSKKVLDYMASLHPTLVLGDCRFTHVEPWLDPTSISDLWHFDGLPDEPHKLDRIFAAVPHRVQFAGHFHRWLLATPAGVRDWDGSAPTCLAGGRFFVVIGALCEGDFATYDTTTCELAPYRVR